MNEVWVLVMVIVEHGTLNTASTAEGAYATMMDCFAARDVLMDFFQEVRNKQAVCIPSTMWES